MRSIFYPVENTIKKIMIVDSSELGLAFGSAGATMVVHVRHHHLQMGLLRQKTVEMLLQRARWRLSRKATRVK
jgi:hypothetical protein